MRTKVFLFILISVLSINVSSGQKSNKKITVSGTVTDAMKRPIAGAFIFIDGKSTDIVTNDAGFYKLKIRPDADSITVLTVTNGMGTAAISSRTNIDFVLGGSQGPAQSAQTKPDNGKQVDIGYGKVNERDLLTQVSTVEGKNNKYASYKDIYEILKGLPGVVVRGHSIQIQGPSSINSGTEPLFVVDGMVVESVDGLSPSMVKSISVLKGASASIYGSRGTNGAILITLYNGSDKDKK